MKSSPAQRLLGRGFGGADFFLNFLVQDGNANRRLIPCAGDRDGYDCPNPVFLKKWIKYFQEERFAARDRLREFRLETEMAIEIELASQDVVSAHEVDGRARYAEAQS